LWKDKPVETLGQWFGHKYRILDPEDAITSINLPWIVEFYVNFGPLGVVIGMAAVGALMALLEQFFLQPGMTEVEVIAGWALLFRLFYQESNVSLMVGGLLPQMIFLGVLLFIALRLCRSEVASRL
jgi:NhaP-type Na+/H+ and K+/H+ antiporter